MSTHALHLRADDPKAVCVLVHGRGQSPEEMQSHILARLDAPDVTFVLPRAADGSWYAAKAVDPLTDDTRGALGAALDQLEGDVAAARRACPGLPLMLAGFSQGACLSLEYACSGRSAPGALVAFTGCRVGAPSDDRPLSLPDGLPVYLTGSDNDPWIPVQAFAEAALDLGRQKARLRTDLFPGRGHEVSDAEIAMMQTVLADLAHGKTPAMAAPR
ncbi:putative hydrolase [Marinibacterium anthonyi]|nr:putative hydrolase [Marinibacterium anthonyi]